MLLDSGSLLSLFAIDVANHLGLQLQLHDPQGQSHQLFWRGQRFRLGFARVEIALTDDNGGRLEWEAELGFTDAPIGYGLLGQQGALEYLDATFRLGDLVLELEPNRFFPGSALPVSAP